MAKKTRKTSKAKKPPTPPPTRTLQLTDEEIALIQSALDSHAYWQLSDDKYRSDGFVLDPGNDDPETAEEIALCGTLATKLPGGAGMTRRRHSIAVNGPLPMTEVQYQALCAEDMGICRSCGNEQGNCEPDARHYKCDACGQMQVFGTEELLARGEIDIQ